ncbi:MAG: hypothetical protein PHE79_09005 [Eubacteriales bacterium]|nr:hypothetical protein [Eubacteriales bacterium]
MKKSFILIFVCLILLAGCSEQQQYIPKNNNGGTQDINTPNDSENSTPEPISGTNSNSSKHNTLPPVSTSSDVIEIKEKLFIAQTNDIYINPQDYLGKTLKYEGIFDSYYYDVTDTTYYYVIRYGPGCCGFDANAGFEVVWSGDYPNKNDWVEVIGVLEEFEEDGYKYLRLNLSSLVVLDTRGEEYVYQ